MCGQSPLRAAARPEHTRGSAPLHGHRWNRSRSQPPAPRLSPPWPRPGKQRPPRGLQRRRGRACGSAGGRDRLSWPPWCLFLPSAGPRGLGRGVRGARGAASGGGGAVCLCGEGVCVRRRCRCGAPGTGLMLSLGDGDTLGAALPVAAEAGAARGGGGGSATTWRRRLRGHETFLPPPRRNPPLLYGPCAALERPFAAARRLGQWRQGLQRTQPIAKGACRGDVSARPGPRCTVGCWRPRVGAGRKGGCHGDEYRADPSVLCGQQIPGDPGGAATAGWRVTGWWGAVGKGAGRRETGRGLRVVSAATWRGRGGRGRAGALRETRPGGREKTVGGRVHSLSHRFRCCPPVGAGACMICLIYD